jgi:hypothetical protein
MIAKIYECKDGASVHYVFSASVLKKYMWGGFLKEYAGDFKITEVRFENIPRELALFGLVADIQAAEVSGWKRELGVLRRCARFLFFTEESKQDE